MGKVDLNANYGVLIEDADDKLSFDEVVKCYDANAMRAAYVFIWIAAAEGLKRRFRVASNYDATAAQVTKTLIDKEKKHESVDTFLVTEAYNYGFISDAEKAELTHVFQFRSIYAHPYEQEPTAEQLIASIESVTRCVLTKPIKFKRTYIDGYLNRIFNESPFLEDSKDKVAEFTEQFISRINEDSLEYLHAQLFTRLNSIRGNFDKAIFYRRASWVLELLLSRMIGDGAKIQWHKILGEKPKVAAQIFGAPTIFVCLDGLSQDTLIDILLDKGEGKPEDFQKVESLIEQNLAKQNHYDKFMHIIDKFNFPNHSQLSAAKLVSKGLRLQTCFSSIIAHLKITDWYIQNPIAEYVHSRGTKDILQLSGDNQNILGRNILQAAHGSSGGCISLLVEISKDPNSYPLEFLLGIVLECFVNDSGQFRCKIRQIDHVIKIISGLHVNVQKDLITRLLDSIYASDFKYHPSFESHDLTNLIPKFADQDWAINIIAALAEKLSISQEDNS